MSTQTSTEQICCPPFDPERWDNLTLEWHSKPFIKDKVSTFMYMPFGFGKVMRRLDALIRSAGASVPDWLTLSDHTSSWNMNLLLAVDKEVPGANNINISGKFFCKVYEGSFQNTGKWTKDFDSIAKSKGLSIKKTYMWYTTCPKCAKKYGKNYVAIFGEF